MGKTYIHKLAIKANKGLIKIPIKMELMYNRFNYSLGKLRCRRNKIKENIADKEFKNECNEEE